MKQRIYISGPITGIEDENIDAFSKAENNLRVMGFQPVNPHKLNEKCETYADYIRRDIRVLLKCSSVFMLKGWEKSKGARCEHNIAFTLGMTIIYEE